MESDNEVIFKSNWNNYSKSDRLVMLLELGYSLHEATLRLNYKNLSDSDKDKLEQILIIPSWRGFIFTKGERESLDNTIMNLFTEQEKKHKFSNYEEYGQTLKDINIR